MICLNFKGMTDKEYIIKNLKSKIFTLEDELFHFDSIILDRGTSNELKEHLISESKLIKADISKIKNKINSLEHNRKNYHSPKGKNYIVSNKKNTLKKGCKNERNKPD